MSALDRLSPLRFIAAASLCVVMAACSSGDPGTRPSPQAESSSSSTADKGADALTIDVELADGKVTPNGEKINISKGQKIKINVTSDHDEEIHVHGDYDIELQVKADQPASTSFVADKIGSFEMESHHPAKIIAILNIR